MRDAETGALTWIAERWVVCALFMACALLAVAPILFASLPLAVVLLFLHSPVYMLHQVEEHTHDRFRRFANAHLFHGAEGLTTKAVVVINLPVVWGLNLGALYAGWLFGAGWGLAAPYCLLVNALAHVVTSLRLRIYNPGLVTACLLFAPPGAFTLWWISKLPETSVAQQMTGFGLAVGLHLAIIASTLRHVARLRPAGTA